MIRLLAGYFLIAFSGILFLSILSFSVQDSSFFTSNFTNIPSNIAGKLGVILSSFFITFYGKISSYLLSFGIFSVGINCLVNKKLGRIILKALLFFIAAVSLSITLSSITNSPDFITTGLIGIVISNIFSELLPKTFVFFIFVSLFVLSLFSSMKLFRSLSILIGKGIMFLFVFPFSIFLSLRKRNPGKPVEKNDLSFLEAEPQAHNDSVEKIEEKEPEFLKSEKEIDLKKQGLEEFTPSWLVNENEKKNLVDFIQKKGLEETVSLEEENEIKSPSFEEETSIPSREAPPPEEVGSEDMVESELEIEEISGEPNYIEEKLQKESSTDFPTYLGEEKKRDSYIFPSVYDLEKGFSKTDWKEIEEEIRTVSEIIETTFASFKIDVKVIGYSRGPSITRYEIMPPEGLKLRSIINLTDDLALKLGTKNIRIVAPIGHRSLVGIEVPNRHRDTVVIRDIIESEEFKNTKAVLPLILGKGIAGNVIIEDLTEMPHLLIAGTTGSGKSVFVNSLIAGLVFTRTSEEVKFIFIDPKMVELELYNDIPHLLSPVITSPEEAIAVLEWVSSEMDRRYELLSEFGVRNILDYNKLMIKKEGENEDLEILPFIVVVIDEFANLILRLPRETEKVITRIAAMARATGIHLVVATQRPSVDVVTGIIKANFPSRIAFRVSSQTDSRTVLDKSGAEKLLGKGDFLFMTPGFTDLIRIQAPFVSIRDVETIVNALLRNGRAEYVIDPFELIQKETEDETDKNYTDYSSDPLFQDCLKEAVERGEVSASFLQRKFRIGYNRASRIIDTMDQMKILGPSRGAGKPREVLISKNELERFIQIEK